MKIMAKPLLACVAALLLLSGCMSNRQVQTVKYPGKVNTGSERKSGPAMIFYEAAEQAADPNNVEVVPPAKKN
jgi:uncharacterized lipoprotein YajG